MQKPPRTWISNATPKQGELVRVRAQIEHIMESGLRTDAEGRVTVETPWAGRYVAETIHTEERAGGEGDGAYARIRYVSTLSFSVGEGIAWTGR